MDQDLKNPLKNLLRLTDQPDQTKIQMRDSLLKLDLLMRILQRKLIDKVDPQKGVEHLRAVEPQKGVEPQRAVEPQKGVEQRVKDPPGQSKAMKVQMKV